MDPRDYRLLTASPLFSGLSLSECEGLAEFLKAGEKTYAAGAILHLPGTELKRFGYVLSGLVQVYRDETDGTRMLMASCGPGGSFGESLCFLKVKSAPVTIMAAEDSRVLWLSMDGVRKGAGSRLLKKAAAAATCTT